MEGVACSFPHQFEATNASPAGLIVAKTKEEIWFAF
jgi:hypothetical protein